MSKVNGKSLTRGLMAAVVGGAALPLAPLAVADDLGAVVTSEENGRAARHILNFRDVELQVLIDDIASMTGYTFVVAPSVRGRVTVSSQTPLTAEDVFKVFQSTLRVHGFTAVPVSGGAYRIVPEQAASSEGIRSRGAGDQFETVVMKLDHFDAVEAAKMIKPITHSQGQVSTSARSNSIIVVDYASNISRVRQVVRELDQDRSTIVTIPLTNMPATEMAKIVNGITAGDSSSFKFEIGALAVESNNSIVIRGDASDVARVSEIVYGLDQESRSATETLKVLPLRHSQAADLAPILGELATSMKEAISPSGGQVAKPTIVVHEPMNALVINADARILKQLERVVEELDQRRAQVLVEALIVELSDDTVRELGVQFALSGSDDTSLPLVATNFSRSTNNVLAIAGALALDNDDTGVSSLRETAISSLLGSTGVLFGFGATNSDGSVFGAIVNAVQDDTASNLLSTPSVLTLDNETASFIVGQEIPITTGEALGNNNSNPFRTVEREDVGVELEVTPQIGDADSITLTLRQEVSSIFGPITTSSTDLITNKREITTTVLADDGEIIVLGGLIEEETSRVESKVPLLGDIPVLGNLFRSEGTSVSRTNLMVFLRPTIVRDEQDVREVTGRKLNYMQSEQEQATGQEQAIQDFVDEVMGR